MVEFVLDFSQKRWKTQKFTPKFTIYWPLAEKPRASVYFKAACLPLTKNPKCVFLSDGLLACLTD